MYTLEFAEGWYTYFEAVPPTIQIRFKKRIEKYETYPKFKHLKSGVPFFVDVIEEQYRVCFISDEKEKKRIFVFIGKHKDYDKWCARFK